MISGKSIFVTYSSQYLFPCYPLFSNNCGRRAHTILMTSMGPLLPHLSILLMTKDTPSMSHCHVYQILHLTPLPRTQKIRAPSSKVFPFNSPMQVGVIKVLALEKKCMSTEVPSSRVLEDFVSYGSKITTAIRSSQAGNYLTFTLRPYTQFQVVSNCRNLTQLNIPSFQGN